MTEQDRPYTARTPERMNDERRGWMRISAGILGGCLLAWLALLPYVLIRPPESGAGWLLLLLITPPACFAADFMGEKLSGSWSERRPLLKFLKAVLYVMTGLVIVVIMAIGSSIFTR